MVPFLVLDLDGTEQKIVKLDFATRPEHAKLHRYLHPWFVSHLLKKDLSQANPEVEVAIPTTVVNGTPSFEEKEEDVIILTTGFGIWTKCWVNALILKPGRKNILFHMWALGQNRTFGYLFKH